jgi:hypothetical protein
MFATSGVQIITLEEEIARLRATNAQLLSALHKVIVFIKYTFRRIRGDPADFACCVATQLHGQVYAVQQSPVAPGKAIEGPSRVHKRLADMKRAGIDVASTLSGTGKHSKFDPVSLPLLLGDVTTSVASAQSEAETAALREENSLLQDAVVRMKAVANKFFSLEIEEDDLQKQVSYFAVMVVVGKHPRCPVLVCECVYLQLKAIWRETDAKAAEAKKKAPPPKPLKKVEAPQPLQLTDGSSSVAPQPTSDAAASEDMATQQHVEEPAQSGLNKTASQGSSSHDRSPREDRLVATSPIQTPHKPVPCFESNSENDQVQPSLSATVSFPKLKSPSTQVTDPMAMTHSSR